MDLILTQLIALFIVLVLAGVRSVRFLPQPLTTYEINRRIKAGDTAAEAELLRRQTIPFLVEAQQLASIVITMVLVIVLVSFLKINWAVISIIVWLCVAELISNRMPIERLTRRLITKYHSFFAAIFRIVLPLVKVFARKEIPSGDLGFYSRDEFLQMVLDNAGIFSTEQLSMIQSAMGYSEKAVADFMVPLKEVVSVAQNETVGPVLLDRLHKSRHAQFPVLGSGKEVVGMLYMRSVVPLDPEVKEISEVMDDQVFFVEKSQSLDEVLHAFLLTKHRLFIVVDKDAKTVGIISVEDVLRAILGRSIQRRFQQYEDPRAVAQFAAAEASVVLTQQNDPT